MADLNSMEKWSPQFEFGGSQARRSVTIMDAIARPRAAARLVSDQFWTLLEPWNPPTPPAENGRTGRPRVDDRAALQKILFEFETSIGREKPPAERGFGSGSTC
ncbi:transposase [Kocuria nitroreducens]|uniref:transposase n=1 Tax=Kocuria nitroreducens TaxID=3058914 RepID=UPI0036DB1300